MNLKDHTARVPMTPASNCYVCDRPDGRGSPPLCAKCRPVEAPVAFGISPKTLELWKNAPGHQYLDENGAFTCEPANDEAVCRVCGAPAGQACTKECDDDSVPDEAVPQHVLRVRDSIAKMLVKK